MIEKRDIEIRTDCLVFFFSSDAFFIHFLMKQNTVSHQTKNHQGFSLIQDFLSHPVSFLVIFPPERRWMHEISLLSLLLLETLSLFFVERFDYFPLNVLL